MGYNPLILKLGTSECAESYSNILCSDDANLNDNVMLSMMRMFLNENRLKSMTETRGRIQLQIKPATFYADNSNDSGEIEKEVFVHDDSPFNVFHYGIMINVLTNTNSHYLLIESEKYNEDYEALGWKKLEDVSHYIDKDGEVLVYQNESKKGTLIFTGAKKAIQTTHMAASCLPRLLPWCFKNDPITDEEKTIVRYLYECKDNEFSNAMQAVYDSFDFYGKKLALSLKGFCNANYESTISNYKNTIANMEQRIKNTFDQIRAYQKELEVAQIQLAATYNKTYRTDEDEAEIVNYLKVNKTLRLLKKSGSKLYIGYVGYLNDCDEGAFRHCVENQTESKNYIYGDSPYSFEETKAFFLSIWKEHRFNIRTYCEWWINSDDSVDAITSSDMEGHSELTENRIRQPHIDRHACFNQYRNGFEECAQTYDFVGTMATIASSSSYLTWGDSIVVKELMYDLFNSRTIDKKKYLEDNNGNLYTVAEVFEILKKEKEAVA